MTKLIAEAILELLFQSAHFRCHRWKLVGRHASKGVLQTHGFYVDLEKKTINLDVILDFALEDREKTFAEIENDVQKAYPDFTLRLAMDIDVWSEAGKNSS